MLRKEKKKNNRKVLKPVYICPLVGSLDPS